MDAYLGQIMVWGGSFAPVGWLACEGQLLRIEEYEALYTVIGNTYGGDGMSTFALPDLRGRISNHTGQGPGLSFYSVGEMIGKETYTITQQQLCGHTHGVVAEVKMGANQTDEQDSDSPVDCYPRMTSGTNSYSSTADAAMGQSSFAVTLGAIGGSGPVNNVMPTLSMYFCIATQGIYPPHP